MLVECMQDVGGFDHNDQSLRVLTTLERKYPNWPGLNMTWETLEGVVKHNGPVRKGQAAGRAYAALQGQDRPAPRHLSPRSRRRRRRCPDDIAYNNHDVEDGLRAGLF